MTPRERCDLPHRFHIGAKTSRVAEAHSWVGASTAELMEARTARDVALRSHWLKQNLGFLIERAREALDAVEGLEVAAERLAEERRLARLSERSAA